MSNQALLNINQIAARKGAAELEFAVKKVNSLDKSKGGPEGYLKAIERRVEDLVFDEVQKFQKEDNLLSTQSGSIINNSNITWILKPIDGTENFLKGYPHFSISLCSVVDNLISSAVIIDPMRREEFSACSGSGASLNNNKIRASKQNTLKDATLSFRKSVKDKSFDFEKSHKELANQELNMRESGCLSLDLAYVGAGRLDGVWAHNINLIDFAAGTLIAQEGGALVSNFKGDPKYMDDNNVIASTSKVYKSILKSVKPYYQD